MRAKLVLVGALAAIVCTAALPAKAVDRGNIGTIGPKNPTIKKSFPPLAGVYPTHYSPRQPFAGYRPPTCRTVTYCDSVEIGVDYPARYKKEVLFGVLITVEWENPRTKDNPTGNDLDVFLWGDDGPAAGGPTTKCGTPSDPKCDNLKTESVRVIEPDRSTVKDGEPLFVTIVNDSGVNTGYQLTVQWFTFDLPPPPQFQSPERDVSSLSSRVAGPFDVTPSRSKIGDGANTPGERELLVPGPDGKLHVVTLPVYAAGQRVPASTRRGVNPWIPAAAGIVALAGMSAYLYVRSRRRPEF